MNQTNRVPFDTHFEKLEEGEIFVPFLFGITLSLILFISSGWRPAPEVCIILGIVATLITMFYSRKPDHIRVLSFTIAYTALSAVIYLFAYLEAKVPALFWIILAIAAIALIFIALISVSFIATRDRPDMK